MQRSGLSKQQEWRRAADRAHGYAELEVADDDVLDRPRQPARNDTTSAGVLKKRRMQPRWQQYCCDITAAYHGAGLRLRAAVAAPVLLVAAKLHIRAACPHDRRSVYAQASAINPLGPPAGCFLALGSGLGLVGTASSRR